MLLLLSSHFFSHFTFLVPVFTSGNWSPTIAKVPCSALAPRWWNLQPCLCINALLIEPWRTTPVSIVLWSDTSGGLFFHLMENLTWEHRHPKVCCQHLQGKANPSSSSSSSHRASYHFWNATPTPIVLRKLRRKDTMHCTAVCVCVYLSACDYSQLSVLYIFVMTSHSRAAITTRGSTSISFLLHTDMNRTYALVCCCYLRSFPCRAPRLHTSPAGTLLSLFSVMSVIMHLN